MQQKNKEKSCRIKIVVQEVGKGRAGTGAVKE
jgi:hypothetical protein